jgi:hypothetical protein
MAIWLKKTYGGASGRGGGGRGINSVTVLYDRPPASVFMRLKSTATTTATTTAAASGEETGKGEQQSGAKEHLSPLSAEGEGEGGVVVAEQKSPPEVPVAVRHDLLVKLQLTDEILFPFSSSSSSSSSGGQVTGGTGTAMGGGSQRENSPSPGLVAMTSSSFTANATAASGGIDPSWIIERTIHTIRYRVPSEGSEQTNEVSPPHSSVPSHLISDRHLSET